MQRNADIFGGNFSVEKRFSYFNHCEDGRDVPCGFFKHFPVCNLAWSKNVNELVNTHGYSQNQIIVWRYPTMSKCSWQLSLVILTEFFTLPFHQMDSMVAISRHPYYVHTMDEAMATARWKKWWDVDALKTQMEMYHEHGLEPWTPKKPYPTDVPDSALMLRKHSMASNLFSYLLFYELEAFNPRDNCPSHL
ncbi:hypothetical protein TSUD_382980 [Olea europaea subsp. europaea]|uniref:TOD1/MUCI70 glycosyltransferase-like domain-containing protein n=1 Tax=Olea europaea subsp. europaea TaxID=158383 RepID=A0A8S0VPX7_OLEEU|nr:hypothetical protein TSUD_382980 [Olea europaea subsp. europaea]